MPTPSSNIGIIDFGLKTLLYSKFGGLMGLTDSTTDVNLIPFDVALRETAEKRSGDKLNFISYWRMAAGPDWDRRRSPMGRRGIEVAWQSSGHTNISVLKAVPVDIKYEVNFWVYKDKFDNLQTVTDEYIFWHDDNPSIDLTFNGFPLKFQLYTDPLEDVSSIATQYTKGVYYVYKANVWVDGWLPKFELDFAVTKIFVKAYDINGTAPIELYTDTVQ